MVLNVNPLMQADSYKHSHFLQYPPNTEIIYSYIEPRQPLFGDEDKYGNQSVFFGLQMGLMDIAGPIITKDVVDYAEDRTKKHGLPFNRVGWDRVVNKHGGCIPLLVKAVAEGTVMDVRNVQVTVENTDPELPFLTSFFETYLLRSVWYGSTVATVKRESKKIIYQYLMETSDAPDDQINFKLHDFGARGVSSGQSAGIGGAAHMVNFKGTDTMEALEYVKHYYGEEMGGFSIPAAEHSTITSWGRTPEHEREAYENMINQFAKPGAMVAVVSDSYDLDHAVNQFWGKDLKARVLGSEAVVVIRPDSGDPRTVPVKVVVDLMNAYGFTVNSKGYKVLPPCIRVIQGDGISLKAGTIKAILQGLKELKISADNIAFGEGGGGLQIVNRDDLAYAMKCSAACVNGVWRPVVKQPKTDSKKVSKAGRLQLVKEDPNHNGMGHFTTIIENTKVVEHDYLEPVFKNGEMLRVQSFSDIRRLAAVGNEWPAAA